MQTPLMLGFLAVAMCGCGRTEPCRYFTPMPRDGSLPPRSQAVIPSRPAFPEEIPSAVAQLNVE
jgi:hypothetical protein